MSELRDGQLALQEVLKDPRTTNKTKLAVIESLKLLGRVDRSVTQAVEVPLADCLQNLTEEQRAAISSACRRTAAAALAAFSQAIALETARMAAEAQKAH